MRFLKTGLLSVWVIGCIASFSVRADTIPEELVDLTMQQCKSGCTPSFREEACEYLCKCTAGEFVRRLDYSAYLDLSVELSKNTVSEKHRIFLDTVANYCTGELDKAGIELGTPAEK